MAKGWNDGIFHYEGSDYLGRKIAVDITYDPANLAIINPGLTGTRDPGCLFNAVRVGRDEDGTTKTFQVPVGEFNVGRQQLRNQGFDTIQQVADAQITLMTI